MALTLYRHPLSSFCHKVLFALYENEIPFTPADVDLSSEQGRADFAKVSPLGKMPVLHDEGRQQTVLETTIILEYLDTHYPGKLKLFPADPTAQLRARYWDRIIDNYLHLRMQKIVDDVRRPENQHDPVGVREAQEWMRKAYTMLENQLADRPWILGAQLSVADCAALPALFYGQAAFPYRDTHPGLDAYLQRLCDRAAVQKVLAEAKPFIKYFPLVEKLPARFR